ncbi:MAG TPA: hypothetical protein VM597_02645 [Gemmataceae bacterium]|nr:hypothetical protein [Gemmataceae bacterium]
MQGYTKLHTTELLTDPPLAAHTYQTPHRHPLGRRIVVKDRAGVTQFDTDDHTDIGNACDAVDQWATAMIKAGVLGLHRDFKESEKSRQR